MILWAVSERCWHKCWEKLTFVRQLPQVTFLNFFFWFSFSFVCFLQGNTGSLSKWSKYAWEFKVLSLISVPSLMIPPFLRVLSLLSGSCSGVPAIGVVTLSLCICLLYRTVKKAIIRSSSHLGNPCCHHIN